MDIQLVMVDLEGMDIMEFVDKMDLSALPWQRIQAIFLAQVRY